MPASDTQNTPSRNAPCPCGSGKKYKRCCGQQAGARPGGAGPARPDQLQRVIQYYQQGKLQLAGETAASLLKANPDDAGLIEISAAVAAQTGHVELAVEQFTRLVQLQPGNALAHSNLCMLLHTLDRDEEAFMHGQQAIQLDPQLADAWNNLGNVYQSGNHLEGAREHYEKALTIDPDDPEILANAGVVCQLLGDLETAEQRYRHATQVAPEFAGAHNNLGAVLQKQEHYIEAGHTFNTALGLQPDNPEILTNLGALMLEQGNAEKAGEYLQRAIDHAPEYAGAWVSLGNLHDSLHENELATQYWNKALQLDPDNPTVLCNIGFRLFELGHQKEAVEHFVRALKSNPNSVKALAGLGTAMLRQDEVENATKYIEKALQLAPWDVHAHMARASLLEIHHQPGEAADEWRYVTAHKPDLPDGYIGLAKHFASQEDYAAARQQYQLAESRIPDSFKLYSAWSQMEESIHDLQVAETLAKKAAALNPGYPGLTVMKAKLARRNKDYQGALDHLEKIDVDTIEDKHVVANYLFEVGAVQDKLGNYSAAFSAYQAANETKNHYAGRVYNGERDNRKNEKLKQLYKPDTWRQLTALAEPLDTPAPQPVFIVGFPRSGTSLLEQILGSHNKISPAGELTGIHDIATSRIKQLTGSKLDYPDFINDPNAPLDTEKINQLRNDYLALASHKCVEKENIAWITDKMPHNARHIGLIRILFPHAPVIHIVRHPLNPCLSAYFSNFKTSHRYTSDLKSTALHYKQVMGLVEHYREIGIDFLDIKYEDMVINQEAVTRKVLEYIGAPWDEAVLQHHKSTRVVKTASYEQVTQKVYTSSLNRYQNYWDAVQEIIPILQPTIDRLGYTVEPPPKI